MSDLSSSLHPRQKGRSQNPSSLANIKTLVTLGMLTALAYAVMAVCKVIPAVGGFLSFDLKDTVMAIGGFLFGPAAALAMAIVVPFIEFVTVSDTGWYGLIMNIIATTLFVLPAVLIYRRRHKTSAAILGLVVGSLLAVFPKDSLALTLELPIGLVLLAGAAFGAYKFSKT